jgi:PAS domain S-box-containing protein
MAEIVIIKGGAEIGRVRLGAQTVSVGRDAGNGITIDDPRVSRQHAEITHAGGEYTYQDTGSTLGSLLAGKEISQHVLQDGDTIDIGKCRLVFLLADGAPAPQVDPPAATSWSLNTWPSLEHMLERADASGESSKLLKALFEISLALDAAEEFDGILARIMDKALVIMGGERGFIMLKDVESGELRLHSARDCNGPITGVDAEGVSKSLMEKVVVSGEPVLIGDTRDPEWQTKSMVANKIHSALCVPLKNGAEVAGVIYVDHRSRPQTFTETDLAFFTTFAIQAKAAIDSSRAYWKLVDGLFSASGDFVVVCSPQGRITRVNTGASELLGKATLAEQSVADAVTPEDRKAATELCQEVLTSGRAAGRHLRFIHGDGRLVPLSLSGFVMRGAGGQAQGICLIGRDLSKEMQLIDDLKGVTARLFEVNNMKSEFVGMITHELKGPLSVIMGYADLLEEPVTRDSTEKTDKAVAQIQAASVRAQDLIEELLELNRLETGRTELSLAEINVKDLMLEAVQGQALAAQKRGVSVDVHMADPLPRLQGDVRLLRRVFDNFISNGIKYNKEQGRLDVSVTAAVGRLDLRFADEGIGIAKADQEKVFTQFFRADNVRGTHQGTGLGLSIVKAIIERHGGSLSLESEVGKGTVFIASLPLKPPAA